MMRRIARITMARVARIAAGLALVVAGLAVLPAGQASASSNIVAVWSDQSDYVQVSCSQPGTYTYGSRAIQVYNPCGDRVWLHYYDNSNGHVYTYCVNPGGGLAYDFPYPFTDLQLTNNASQCDAGVYWVINWFPDGSPVAVPQTWSCDMGAPPFTWPGYFVGWITDGGCNFRIWLHQNSNGTGNSECVYGKGDSPTNTSPAYLQVQETYNQAPCNAGGPPYPY